MSAVVTAMALTVVGHCVAVLRDLREACFAGSMKLTSALMRRMRGDQGKCGCSNRRAGATKGWCPGDARNEAPASTQMLHVDRKKKNDEEEETGDAKLMKRSIGGWLE
jgi:hypothetical protein